MEGIKLGNKKSKYPIIQGGMGVGVSMHKLAGTVSKEGGIGIKFSNKPSENFITTNSLDIFTKNKLTKKLIRRLV